MDELTANKIPPSWYRRERDFDFWRGQVWPRRRNLIGHWYTLFSLIACLITILFSKYLPKNALKISGAAMAELSFATISFGACVTALVLTLSLSTSDQIHMLSIQGIRGKSGVDFSALSDLIFVFIWAGIAQLVAVSFSLLALILGSEALVFPPNPSIEQSALQGAALAIGLYSFLNLYAVLVTISQIGAVIIHKVTGTYFAPAADNKFETI